MDSLPPKKAMLHSAQPLAEQPKAENAAFGDIALQKVHSQLLREKEEPTEGFSPVPIFLIFVFGALMFWSGLYMANNSGGFRSDVFDGHWRPTAESESVAVVFDPMKQGKKLFGRTCQQCHQAEGQGIPGVYPPLSNSAWIAGDPHRAAKILILGMSGPLEVEGSLFNGNMPPVGTWSDRDIAAVLTYVRSSFGNNAPAVDESTVKDARASLGGRSSPWSPDEILKLHPLEG